MEVLERVILEKKGLKQKGGCRHDALCDAVPTFFISSSAGVGVEGRSSAWSSSWSGFVEGTTELLLFLRACCKGPFIFCVDRIRQEIQT